MGDIGHLLVDTVTVVYRGVTGTDEYGSDIIGETSRADVSGWMHQRTSEDMADVAAPNADVGDWLLYLGPGLLVDRLTHYEYEGRVFETVGLPRFSKTPRGGPHHIEIELEEFQGA
jgi:hypothetical protein